MNWVLDSELTVACGYLSSTSYTMHRYLLTHQPDAARAFRASHLAFSFVQT